MIVKNIIFIILNIIYCTSMDDNSLNQLNLIDLTSEKTVNKKCDDSYFLDAISLPDTFNITSINIISNIEFKVLSNCPKIKKNLNTLKVSEKERDRSFTSVRFTKYINKFIYNFIVEPSSSDIDNFVKSLAYKSFVLIYQLSYSYANRTNPDKNDEIEYLFKVGLMIKINKDCRWKVDQLFNLSWLPKQLKSTGKPKKYEYNNNSNYNNVLEKDENNISYNQMYEQTSFYIPKSNYTEHYNLSTNDTENDIMTLNKIPNLDVSNTNGLVVNNIVLCSSLLVLRNLW